jgi:hypothetical protein
LSPRLIVRLDDACETMAADPWRRLESALDRLGARPIVGVIPDCRDPSLALAASDPRFWDRVRAWRDKGWGVALHGLHHVYHPHPPAARSLVPFHAEGEFTGLPFERQREIIARAWAVFQRHGVAPDFFMAPSHSFDRATLKALHQETPIRWVSDGLSYRPFSREGFKWLPQQIGRLWRLLPPGMWTLAIHPNTLSPAALDALIESLTASAELIADPFAVMRADVAAYGVPDRIFERAYWSTRAARRLVSRGA